MSSVNFLRMLTKVAQEKGADRAEYTLGSIPLTLNLFAELLRRRSNISSRYASSRQVHSRASFTFYILYLVGCPVR